jgi:hypothetical protein
MKRCQENIVMKALAEDTEPHYSTISNFIKEKEEEIKNVFKKEKPFEKALVLRDTGYFSEENLKVAEEHEVAVLISDQQFRTRGERFEGRADQNKGRYPLDQFMFKEETNSYSCPEGKELSYKGVVKLNRNRGKKHQAKSSDCKGCPCREKYIASRGGTKSPKWTLFVSDKAGSDNRCERMREKIDEVGNRIKYGQRMEIIAPVFANIRYCKEMNRFTMRGKVQVNRSGFCIAPCTTEGNVWRLMARGGMVG